MISVHKTAWNPLQFCICNVYLLTKDSQSLCYIEDWAQIFLVILSGKCQKLEELESLKLAGTREMQRDEHKIWDFFFAS